MDEMIYHTKAVAKGVQRAMIVVDMPFMSYQLNVDEAFRNAGRIMKETSAGAVKLEGGERIAETINKITESRITCNGAYWLDCHRAFIRMEDTVNGEPQTKKQKKY